MMFDDQVQLLRRSFIYIYKSPGIATSQVKIRTNKELSYRISWLVKRISLQYRDRELPWTGNKTTVRPARMTLTSAARQSHRNL